MKGLKWAGVVLVVYAGDLDPGKQLAGISFFGVRTDVGTRTYIDDVVVFVPELGSGFLLALGIGLVGFHRLTRRYSRHQTARANRFVVAFWRRAFLLQR